MSLINQMLQDLAQRQAPAADTLTQIMPIPVQARRKTVSVWIWAAIVCIASTNALAWLWWHNDTIKPQAVITPIANATVKPIVQTAPADIVSPPPAILAPPPVNIATAPAVAAYTATTAAPSLTLSPALAESSSISSIPGKPVNPNELAPNNATGVSKQIKPLTTSQLAENEYRKALALAQQGRINDGMDDFAQALSLDPRHHSARLTLVGLLIENKRMSEAERRLQEGLALDADQTDFAMILARLQVERGSINEGISTLEHSLPYAAEQADYQAFLAALLQRAGRHKQAIERYIIALKKSPQSGVWWMGLGISLKADNQPDKAREAFTRAKASNSLSPELLPFVNQQLS